MSVAKRTSKKSMHLSILCKSIKYKLLKLFFIKKSILILECSNLYGIYERKTGNSKIQYMINEDGVQLYVLGTDGTSGLLVFENRKCIDGHLLIDNRRMQIRYVKSACMIFIKNNTIIEMTKIQCNEEGNIIILASFTHNKKFLIFQNISNVFFVLNMSALIPFYYHFSSLRTIYETSLILL